MNGPRNQILHGDAVQRLGELPAGWVDQIITSPPYFRLRNYATDGQIGLEDTVEDYVATLRTCVAAMRRVLTPTGTLWLNLGDSYSLHPKDGAARKSLLGAPERLMLALIADGWTLRNKIIWAKTNPIPSSVTDRLSTTHEVIYLLAAGPRYHFDLDAIRRPHRTTQPTSRRPRQPGRRGHPKRARPGWLGPNGDGDDGLAALKARGAVGHPLGKNPGDVWQLSPSHFHGAHFAAFPEALIRPMIHAGCPRLRCSNCRAPYTHDVVRHHDTAERQAERPTCRCNSPPEPGLVLDPFLGSGTTAVAAEALGRDWLGIELNPDYITMANQRIAAARADNNPTPLKGGPS
ncbi:site-specific DNA-methyltransferase [Acidipropionibacterium jensenii]|uniref:Methyltransferase n=1 Tax=Acidipropionibacterium jensenii TaxID=1749 RepID=A0A3T0S070_9ACTN|nr:site-specific DNA-methyltransferase [Acidipropionibacterium jensenii]